jgi:hypothetical protein
MRRRDHLNLILMLHDRFVVVLITAAKRSTLATLAIAAISARSCTSRAAIVGPDYAA